MQSIIVGIFFALLAGFLLSAEVMAEACEAWIAKVASAQGSVQARRAGATQWTAVQQRDTFCSGAVIRVGPRSRAAIVAHNEAVYRLEENTTITITAPKAKQSFWLSLKRGAAYFFSRAPRSLKVMTPYANAGVEGTEFVVKVAGDQTLLSVFQGQVVTTNAMGSLTLASGQSAVVKAGQAPAPRVLARPRDAVQWALYYPPIVDFRPADFSGDAVWQAMVRQSIQFYQEGQLQRAFASLAKAPPDIRDARFFTYRAALLLTVGRVDEALSDIERALKLKPGYSQAMALQAIIAVVQNRKDEALTLAERSVELAPASSAAQVALSYAQQAQFDLQGALASLEAAVQLSPGNALAWARLAELQLSIGALKKALDAARKAVVLNPYVARTQTVLGFAYLTQIKVPDAKAAFEQAIELDQAAPLPRLGLGLAQIRQGKLKEGRREIEVSAGLDPNNSLIRSYLGKAYFEEKRDKLSKNQFASAKTLDPQDPTPWFYDAIRKQAINRPVEALQNLQKSIELNNNRAVYRSRLLLDEDLAARSATLGHLYKELGFRQRGLIEGWTSLHADPSNYSAHRFLSDSYAILPRHEIARVSELLQSQLRQPLNMTPIQPQLAESELFILSDAGPAVPSLNEFNPLFNRDRFALLASGVVGSNETWGDEIVLSGVADRMSYSIGQFHYDTDGFRENNDLEQNIINAFLQMALSQNINIQTEFRHTATESGDLLLLFDPNNFLKNLREEEQTESIRFGLHYAPTPKSNFIMSASYRNINIELPNLVDIDQDGYNIEAQQTFRFARLHLTGGVGHVNANRKDIDTIPDLPPLVTKTDIQHTNLYMYAQITYPKNVTWTIGGSADFFEGGLLDLNRTQFNPKLGLAWNPFPGATLRAAIFRTLKRTLLSDQTIEPTQVAGFNQFFDDPEGTDAWRYGIGMDQQFSARLYGGAEFSKRDLHVTGIAVQSPILVTIDKVDWEEQLGRAYIYWLPHSFLALSMEYQFEHFKRPRELMGAEEISKLNTHRFSLGVNFFHPLGFSARLKPMYIAQDGKFGVDGPFGDIVSGDDQFWVVDTSMAYRLPNRWGLITLEVRNLFNEKFGFQDTDPANPTIYPERLILGRLTLAF